MINPPTPTFHDVSTTHPFYSYVETAARRQIISGYADGTLRPYNNVTRGQVSKIIVVAAGWALADPSQATFRDVPPENAFYTYVETAYQHQVVSGYADGTFRWNNPTTRGQIAKIVYNALVAPP